MKTKFLHSALLCIISLPSICHAEQRTWKDANNAHSVEADLLTFDGEAVTLKTANGKTVEITLSRLSKEDQQFILNNQTTGLGVDTVELSKAMKVLKQNNMAPPVADGIYVTEVSPHTPASESGLKAGDIIATLEGKPVRSGSFGYLNPENEYKIVVYRPRSKEETTTDKKPSKPPTKKTRAPAKTDGRKIIDFEVAWEKLTLSVRVLPASKLKELQKIQRATVDDWKEWEKQQSQVDVDKRPYELKTDRLGMTLGMFKAKYHRVAGLDNPAPFCSDANPDIDISTLLYRAEWSRAGIVNARTNYPYEESARSYNGRDFEPNIPTVAGAAAQLYVYHFVDGKLYKITIFFHRTDFEKVLTAVTTKYGEPKAREVRTYQNAFGAEFEGEVHLWNNSVSEMKLFERAGNAEDSLLILTHKELAKTADDNIKSKIKPRTDDL